MDRRLSHKQKPRANPASPGAKRHCSHQTAAIRDTTRRNHKHITNRINNRHYESHCRNRATHMATSLSPLRDNNVNTRINRALCGLHAADGICHDRPRILGAAY